MADIEKFSAAFPDSKFQDQISSLCPVLAGTIERSGAAGGLCREDAGSQSELAAGAVVAGEFLWGRHPSRAARPRPITYAQKAIEVAKPDAADADKPRKVSAGVAHNIIGYAYAFKQGKTSAAIPELKAAAALLKGQDDQQYARALYGLGYAYGKLNQADGGPRGAERGGEDIRVRGRRCAGSAE